jgi:catechol-2,3-dioxygenase
MRNSNPIHVVTIDHLVLRTSQLEAMVHFYHGILACTLERAQPEIGLTQLRAGDALIDIVALDSKLGRLGGSAPKQDGRNVDHFCLQIESLSETALIEYLESHQLIHSEFAERYGGQGFGHSIYLEDPEGNVVELKPNSKS